MYQPSWWFTYCGFLEEAMNWEMMQYVEESTLRDDEIEEEGEDEEEEQEEIVAPLGSYENPIVIDD